MLWRRVPGAVLLLGEDAHEPIALTGPGADLWELLGAPVTESTVFAALSSSYQTDEATVAVDVRKVMRELEERGLVERSG